MKCPKCQDGELKFTKVMHEEWEFLIVDGEVELYDLVDAHDQGDDSDPECNKCGESFNMEELIEKAEA